MQISSSISLTVVQSMNIVILGSGNTATVLAKMMHAAGHSIVQVWSRNQQHAAELAKQVQSKAIHSLQEITTDADLCMIAVSDKAISEVAAELKLKESIGSYSRVSEY
ncbi:MAG: NAD(P)-binding domain-containing protein [Chitinophagaceae bacterium]|nr:NAD(P)-binding domain-containing protein [Chitinophagaceae bacterium]